jgi:nucleoside-diphosphate-sugar epimerase
MSWKGISVLVTGARGFIGGYLVDALTGEGASVTALATGAAGRSDIRWLRGDITEPASLKGACEGIDVVFHLAAISNVVKAIREPGLTLRTNTVGTMNVLEEARASGVKKLVYVSSAHVYGAPKYLPVNEEHGMAPREPYAASKIASEAIVEAYGNAYGMGHAIIRPFNVFGAGQDESFLVPGTISQALKNRAIKVGNTRPTRDFIYVEDCVQGFLAIGDRGTGTYNVGSGREVKISEVVEKIRDLIDRDIPIVSDDDRKRPANVEIPRMCADVTKLKGLGWSVRIGLEEGLARTIKKETVRP